MASISTSARTLAHIVTLSCAVASASVLHPPRTTPIMAWNAWNTFSSNGKPLRGGRPEYQSMAEAMLESGMRVQNQQHPSVLKKANEWGLNTCMHKWVEKRLDTMANKFYNKSNSVWPRIQTGMVAAGYTLLSTVCTDWIGRDPGTQNFEMAFVHFAVLKWLN